MVDFLLGGIELNFRAQDLRFAYNKQQPQLHAKNNKN